MLHYLMRVFYVGLGSVWHKHTKNTLFTKSFYKKTSHNCGVLASANANYYLGGAVSVFYKPVLYPYDTGLGYLFYIKYIRCHLQWMC